MVDQVVLGCDVEVGELHVKVVGGFVHYPCPLFSTEFSLPVGLRVIEPGNQMPCLCHLEVVQVGQDVRDLIPNQ